MIILKDTNDSLELFLDLAVTTNELDIMVSYNDAVGKAKDKSRQLNNSNGTTPVTICDNTNSGNQRYIHYVSIFNSDTANAVINVRYKESTNYFNLKKIELLPNECLEFISGQGWIVK